MVFLLQKAASRPPGVWGGCAQLEVEEELAIVGAEGDADAIGEFLQRGTVGGEQWGFLKEIGGFRQVREGTLLAIGDSLAAIGIAGSKQENLSPAFFYRAVITFGLVQSLADQAQVIREPANRIEKLLAPLGHTKFVQALT